MLVTLCYLSGVAHAQNTRWDLGAPGSAGAVTTSGSGLPFLVALPGVSLQWCSYPANAIPCTNFANTYPSLTSGSPCPTNAQIVLQDSNTCQATGDNFGNLGVYTLSGTYAYTLTVNGVSMGPFVTTVAVGSPGGSTCELEANDSGAFGGVPNTCANFSTGDIASTANISAANLAATATSSAAQFLSTASNPATAGAVALANGDSIFWRNHANSANEGFGVDSSDRGIASFAGGFVLDGAVAKLWFGGTSSSFPMLKPVSTGLQLRLGDDSALAGPFNPLSLKIGAGQALTGNQGSTGVNVFSCTGSFTTNDLVKVDANGNCVDSGQTSATNANGGTLLVQSSQQTASAGDATFTYGTAYVSAAPQCYCTPISSNGGTGGTGSCNIASTSKTACEVNVGDSATVVNILVVGAP